MVGNRQRRRSFGGPLRHTGPLEDDDDALHDGIEKDSASLRELRLSCREVRSLKAALAESERARTMLLSELADAKLRIAELEAALAPKTPVDGRRQLSPPVAPPSPYVVAKTPGGRLCDVQDAVAPQLLPVELPRYEISCATQSPSHECGSFCTRIDGGDNAAAAAELQDSFCARIDEGDSPGAAEPQAKEADFSNIASFDSVHCSPKGPGGGGDDIVDALLLLSPMMTEEPADTEEAQMLREAELSPARYSDEWFHVSIRQQAECHSEPVEAWLSRTACWQAFAVAARNVALDREALVRVSGWIRAACLAEAEHASRADANPPKSRVRFRRYDLSSVELPRDTVRDSESEAEAVVQRLAAVRAAGKAAGASDLAALECGLREAAVSGDAIDFETRELRGAAAMWAQEAASLQHNDTPSPVISKLSELVSSVLRFHLRRLLNAPPLPTAKKPATSRLPLTALNADSSDSRRETRALKAAKQRRDSLGGRCEFLELDNPYTWSRSEVHKHLKLQHKFESMSDGALASQFVAALGHYASASTALGDGYSSVDRFETADDLAAARDHLEAIIEPRLVAACATRFLDQILNFSNLDRLVASAGGWDSIESFAEIAVCHASPAVAALFAPCTDINGFKNLLKYQLDTALQDKTALLAELSKLTQTLATCRRLQGARDLAAAARALTRTALSYPDCVPVNTD